MKLTWTFKGGRQTSQDLSGDYTHALEVAEANPGEAVVQEIEGPGVFACRALVVWNSSTPDRGSYWTGWVIKMY